MDQESSVSKLPQATLVYMLTTRVIALVILFVASFFIQSEGNSASPWMISGGIFVLGVIVVVFTVLSYNLFSYAVTGANVVINSGVILRESKTIDFDKMQNVNVVRDPLLMVFGLSRIEIWTASPAQMNFSSVSVGPNGQRTALPKPKPEATLVLLKDEAEMVCNTMTQTGTVGV